MASSSSSQQPSVASSSDWPQQPQHRVPAAVARRVREHQVEAQVGVVLARGEAAVGERRGVRLVDGSVLQLSTDTAVDLNMANHRLHLIEGEIALSVYRAQPIDVDFGLGRVATGQAQICLYRDSYSCRISVLDGNVDVQPEQGMPLTLHYGDQLTLYTDGSGAMGRFDPHAPDWRDGVLSANNQPLGEFLREVGRYHPGILRWDPALESLKVTGTFALNDTDRILALLAASLPVTVLSRSRYWVTLVPQTA